MKTVGIFIGPCYMKWDENTVKNGMGGSETWAHEVASRLSQKGYDIQYGARPLKRYLQKYVETLVARLILSDEISMGSIIEIALEENQLVARKK